MAFPSTFVDLQNEVLNRGRLSSTADLAKVKDWLNQDYAALCESAHYFESSATATLNAGDKSVTLPASIVKLEFVVVTSGGVTYKTTSQVSFEEILDRRAFSSGQASVRSVPTRFALRYTSVEFWPDAAGGETLTFYGDILPTALSADTDVPIIPEPFRDAISYASLVRAMEFKRDTDMLAFYQAKADDRKRSFMAFARRREGAQTQQMRVIGTESRMPHDPSTDLGFGSS